MSTQTSILGIITDPSSETSEKVLCAENSYLYSTTASDLPTFVAASTLQADWNSSDVASVSYINNKPSSLSPTPSSASRSLNSAFQLSATRNALVNYSVDVSCALSLTSGETGTVFLEYADDSGFTTNVVEVCRFVNSNTGSLAIGLNQIQAITSAISGFIPLNKYCRMRTANTLGTPTFNFRSGQEILL